MIVIDEAIQDIVYSSIVDRIDRGSSIPDSIGMNSNHSIAVDTSSLEGSRMIENYVVAGRGVLGENR